MDVTPICSCAAQHMPAQYPAWLEAAAAALEAADIGTAGQECRKHFLLSSWLKRIGSWRGAPFGSVLAMGSSSSLRTPAGA